MSVKLWDKIRTMLVTDRLTIGKNAVLKRVSANGTEITMTPTYSVLTAARTVLSEESGKHFILNSATAFAVTLPAPAMGLEFWFHIGATEPTTSHTVVTASSANIINGNISSPEDAAGSVACAADSDTITFVASKALHGDFVHLWSDGTNWYADGMASVQDGMTMTQAT